MPTVNGHDVPRIIPPAQILIYFPQGILGLQKLEEPVSPATVDSNLEHFVRVPVYLSDDGFLRLDDDGEYVLPGFNIGLNAPAITNAVHQVKRTVSHVFLDSENEMGAPKRLSSFELKRHSRQSSGSVIDMARQMSEMITADPGATPTARGKESTARQRKGGMFYESVTDLLPDEAAPRDAEAFQTERKRMLGLYLTLHIMMLVAWALASALDSWLVCDCSSLGLYRSCTSCAVNATITDPSGGGASYLPFRPAPKACVDSTNFAQCDSPNFTTVVSLVLVATSAFGTNIIIIIVDLVCHVTPKRPFYPVFFLAIWAISFAAWLIMVLAATNPAVFNFTKLACEAHANAASYILARGKILVQHPLDSATFTPLQLAALGARATTFENLASNCQYGSSLFVTGVSWILYTLGCVVYYYRRYAAWNSVTRRLIQAKPPPVPRPAHHRRRQSNLDSAGPSPRSGGGESSGTAVELNPSPPDVGAMELPIPSPHQRQRRAPDGAVAHFRAALQHVGEDSAAQAASPREPLSTTTQPPGPAFEPEPQPAQSPQPVAAPRRPRHGDPVDGLLPRGPASPRTTEAAIGRSRSRSGSRRRVPLISPPRE